MKKSYIIALFVFIFAAGFCSGIFVGKAGMCKEAAHKYSQAWNPNDKGTWHRPPKGEALSPKDRPKDKRFAKNGEKMPPPPPPDQYGREHELVHRLSFMLHLTREQEKQYFDLLVQNKEEIGKIMEPLKKSIATQMDQMNQKVLEMLSPEQREKYQEIIKEFAPPGFDPKEDSASSTNKNNKQLPEGQ